MSHMNHKNQLLEALQKFQGKETHSFQHKEWPSKPPGFSAEVTVDLQWQGAQKTWIAQTDGVYSTKVAAHMEAARKLMLNASFLHHLVASNWSHIGTGSDDVQSTPTAAQSQCDDISNAKGYLLEILLKLPQRRTPNFNTTCIAPFQCTVTIPAVLDNFTKDLVVVGHVCSTKKATEQAAAKMALHDDRLQALFAHNRTVWLPRPPATVASAEPTVTVVQANGSDAMNSKAKRVKKGCCAACRQLIEGNAMALQAQNQSTSQPSASQLPTTPTDETDTSSQSSQDSQEEEDQEEEELICRHCGRAIHKPGGGSGRAGSGAGTAGPTLMDQIAYPRLPARPNDTLPVVFPVVEEGKSCEDSADFQVTDLLSAECVAVEKVPREEQLRAFHLALQGHLMVVFPTGCGKTFVASLVMHRFRKLNSRKIAVMVVEQCALVQQQSVAIHRDTGMTVSSLRGDCNAAPYLQALRCNCYDALVVTAGALCNYLAQDQLRITDFSVIVFDECHHATKEHPFTVILKQVQDCPPPLQPRVLGLTASLVSGDSECECEAKLAALQKMVLGASIYLPTLSRDLFDSLDLRAVTLTAEQHTAMTALVGCVAPKVYLLHDYFRHFKPSKHSQIFGRDDGPWVAIGSDSLSWQRAENLAAESHLDAGDPRTVHEAARQLRDLVVAMRCSYLLGPAFISPSVRDENSSLASLPGCERFEFDEDGQGGCSVDGALHMQEDKVGQSAQLHELCSILESCGSTSCTLVFVQTRDAAETLCSYLQHRFPALGCEKVIGQGGADGMRWARQSGVLQRFRAGTTKLIVSTSVLEEGLDVKGCDLVIRLGGEPSLIQLVQSKGRARHNGRLVQICTTEEQDHYARLQWQEACVKAVYADVAEINCDAKKRKLLDHSGENEEKRANRGDHV